MLLVYINYYCIFLSQFKWNSLAETWTLWNQLTYDPPLQYPSLRWQAAPEVNQLTWLKNWAWPVSVVPCAKCDFDWYLTFMRHVRYTPLPLFVLLACCLLVYLRTFPKTNNRHGYPHTHTHTLDAGKILSARSLDVHKQFSTFQHSLIKTEIMGRRTHTRTHGATCKHFTHVFVWAKQRSSNNCDYCVCV